MKNLLLPLIIILSFYSCNERIVQLPETTSQEITEVIDVSPIYMFYDETKPEGIDFNRKNMISTTNWLVNIDKRLTLKQVLPHLQYLQEKRHGDGMHTNKSAKNYFSCSNPEIQNLAFIEFTDINFSNSSSYANNNQDLEIRLKINAKNSITTIPDIGKSYNSVSEFLKTKPKQKIIFMFNENLTIQDYITIKSQLLSHNSEAIKVSDNEFIYN